MVLAIEPRLAIGEMYLVGVEDLVRVTESGGVSLNRFEKALALEPG
jgi:Xaa-Pro aminopeptidase